MKRRKRSYKVFRARHTVAPSNTGMGGSGARGNSPSGMADSAAQASEKAFLDMLDRNRNSIMQVCLLYTDGKSDNIRDLYQEIVCTLWEAWPNRRCSNTVANWVRRIALNVVINDVRRRARHPDFVALERWMYNSISEGVYKELSESESGDVSEEQSLYNHVIDSLDSDELALLNFRLGRMPLSDIAETLSTTEAAVKQRLYRLRQKINTIKHQDHE